MCASTESGTCCARVWLSHGTPQSHAAPRKSTEPTSATSVARQLCIQPTTAPSCSPLACAQASHSVASACWMRPPSGRSACRCPCVRRSGQRTRASGYRRSVSSTCMSSSAPSTRRTTSRGRGDWPSNHRERNAGTVAAGSVIKGPCPCRRNRRRHRPAHPCRHAAPGPASRPPDHPLRASSPPASAVRRAPWQTASRDRA